jgi:hypothetical protein
MNANGVVVVILGVLVVSQVVAGNALERMGIVPEST